MRNVLVAVSVLVGLALLPGCVENPKITKAETAQHADGTYYTRYHVDFDVSPACVGTCPRP